MCSVTRKQDGSFTQICNCKHGSDHCNNRVEFQGKEFHHDE